MSSKDEQAEDSRRGLQKQLRDMEAELEEERKSRTSAVSARKKQESELRELEQAIDHANKAKDDALRQIKKYSVSYLSLNTIIVMCLLMWKG